MHNKKAFTLVELLVVIAIIALLVSILLPSLESARAQARAVVCAARLKDMGSAGNVYGGQYKDWVPGAPGTTGVHLQYFADVDQKAALTPSTPVQNWDWQTPLAVEALGYDNLKELHRVDRWRRLRELEIFTCPSNNYVGPPFASPSEIGPFEASDTDATWNVQPMNSYSTIREFMYFGKTDSPGGASALHIPVTWDVDTPEGHRPRLTNIRRGSEKVWVTEGSRYAPSGNDPITYQIDYRAGFGGSFSTAGPPSAWSRSYVLPITLELFTHDPRLDRYPYRHPSAGSPGMEVLFYDGHAEKLSKQESIRNVDLWYPSGTVITDIAGEFGNGPNPKPEAHIAMQERVQHHMGPNAREIR